MLKKFLRPAYYALKLNHNRYYWMAKFGIPDQRRIKIGGADFYLHLRFRQELECFNRSQSSLPLCLDQVVADAFVKAGDVCLDVGANIGLTGLLYFQCGASKVIAVEANPNLLQRLRKNTANTQNIEILEIAASDQDGSVELVISAAHNQGSSIDRDTVERFSHIFGRKPETAIVQARKLDSVVKTAVDFVKIDIEGAELLALNASAKH